MRRRTFWTVLLAMTATCCVLWVLWLHPNARPPAPASATAADQTAPGQPAGAPARQRRLQGANLRLLTPAEYRNTIHDLFRIRGGTPDSSPVRREASRVALTARSGMLPMHELAFPVTEDSDHVTAGSSPVKRLARYAVLASHLVHSDQLRDRSRIWNFLFVEDTGRTAGPLTAQACRRLRVFLPRALRREVSDRTLAHYCEHFDQQLQRSGSFTVAMQSTVASALLSREFLFRKFNTESETEKDPYTVASQLSYLLWSSMPDDLLFQAAREGRLLGKREVRGQVRRMLKDSRSKAFAANFVRYWLKTGPGDSLALFEQTLAENRSVMELVDPQPHLAAQETSQTGMFQASYRPGSSDQTPPGILVMGVVNQPATAASQTRPVVEDQWLRNVIFNRPAGNTALPVNRRIQTLLDHSTGEPDAVRAWIVMEKKSFVTGLAEHLLQYALGRSLEISDQSAASNIANTVIFNKGRFTRLVEEVAISSVLGSDQLFPLPRQMTFRPRLRR